MITLTCDRCEKLLEVDDDLAGAKVECPHCGDINAVPPRAARSAPAPAARPAKSAPTGKSDRAAAMGLPSEHGPEQRVLLVHPAMFRASPAPFFGVVLLVIGGILGAIVFQVRTPSSPTLTWICAILALIGLGIMAAWKILSMTERLEITTKRVVLTRGLLSKDLSEVPHEDIKNIQIKQSFFERMMGVGQIGISSAGQDDIEIVIGSIPRPYQVREMIDAYRTVMD